MSKCHTMISTTKFLKFMTGKGKLTVDKLHRFTTCLADTHSSPLSTSIDSPMRLVHTTACFQFPGHEWRKKHGLPRNPNAYGPMTDGPDYSFLDGRPTLVGTGKIRRAKEQKEIAEKIIRLNAEVDMAVDTHAAQVINEKEKRDKIVTNKLKPKGNIPPGAI